MSIRSPALIQKVAAWKLDGTMKIRASNEERMAGLGNSCADAARDRERPARESEILREIERDQLERARF